MGNDYSKYDDIIESAYKKFRTKVYYENTLLYLKQKIYDFDNKEMGNASDVINRVHKILNIYEKDKNGFDEKIAKEVEILIYPKKIIEERKNNDDDNTEESECYIESTMPVINCPIEYYVIDMIVSMYLVKEIEYFREPKKRNSYTYSINENFFKKSSELEFNIKSKLMFNSYSYGYSKWYNNAKKVIMENIEKNVPVIVFKADYNSFYFNNGISFKEPQFRNLSEDCKRFLNILKDIIEVYTKKLKSTLINLGCALEYCVPVGFNSSLILAELMAKKFDVKILKEKMNNDKFLYYGRYADDMLFVYKYDNNNGNIEDYLKCYKNFESKLNERKCSSSTIKDIKEIQGSLKLMNTFCTSIVDFNDRMDIIFEEEKYKTEAIDAFTKPKSFKLRRLLMDEYEGYNHIDFEKQSKEYSEIDRLINSLFCGNTCLVHYKLWLDIIKYLNVRNNGLKEIFLKKAEECIENLEILDGDIERYKNETKVKSDVSESLSNIINFAKTIKENKKVNLKADSDEIITFYDLILADENNESELMNNNLCEKKINQYNNCKENFKNLNGFIKKPNIGVKKINDNSIDIYIKRRKQISKKTILKIGLLVNKINDNEIIDTIVDNKTYENGVFLEKIKNAFREASKNEVDYLVAHECYLPASWVDLAAYFCEKYKISFICGLQYENYENTCKNKICVLQYVESSPYCNVIPIIREKNNYSPHEDIYFVLNNKETRKKDDKLNYIIHTDSVNYTTFLCYELTDLNQRAMYKDKVDCVFVPVMNRDTEYFENIINSYSRDIFAYIIQSNSAIYKGTAIYAPFNSDNKIIASGNGGVNNRLIVDEIKIKALREYKNKYYGKLSKSLSRCAECKNLNRKCINKFKKCSNIKSDELPYIKMPLR